MQRDVDGGFGRQVAGNELIQFRHQRFDRERIFVEQQGSIISLDQLASFRSRFTIAEFVLATTDTALAVAGMNLHQQNLSRAETFIAWHAEQSSFDFCNRPGHSVPPSLKLKRICLTVVDYQDAGTISSRIFLRELSRPTMMSALDERLTIAISHGRVRPKEFL